jgi:hypothetical protein
MFKRYHFAFATTIDKAFARLDAAVDATAGFGLAVDATGRIKIFRKQGPALLNGFFPVFVGRFHSVDQFAELRGGFRFNLLAIALFAGFVGVSAISLFNVLTAPDEVAGMPGDWKWQRIRFELQFIGFATVTAFFAWLAGKPVRERVTSLINRARSDTAPDTIEKND